MNAQQQQLVDSLMPQIAAKVISGMDSMEALKESLREHFAFCGEMAMNETSRAKLANTYIFDQYCSRVGL